MENDDTAVYGGGHIYKYNDIHNKNTFLLLLEISPAVTALTTPHPDYNVDSCALYLGDVRLQGMWSNMFTSYGIIILTSIRRPTLHIVCRSAYQPCASYDDPQTSTTHRMTIVSA